MPQPLGALNFGETARTHFAYRLDGYDRDWVYSGVRDYIAYTNLPAGAYTRYMVDDQPRLSELAVPILHDGRVIGVIGSEHSRRDFFTNHHIEHGWKFGWDNLFLACVALKKEISLGHQSFLNTFFRPTICFPEKTFTFALHFLASIIFHFDKR